MDGLVGSFSMIKVDCTDVQGFQFNSFAQIHSTQIMPTNNWGGGGRILHLKTLKSAPKCPQLTSEILTVVIFQSTSSRDVP
jgi:hypothetical protein